MLWSKGKPNKWCDLRGKNEEKKKDEVLLQLLKSGWQFFPIIATYRNTYFWIEAIKPQKTRYIKLPIIALKSYFLQPECSHFSPLF